MNETPKIFISYCQDQKKMKDCFKALLEDMGFDPVVFDHGHPHNPLETEISLIRDCVGLLGILTPDLRLAGDEFQPSTSVITEITIAFTHAKVVQLFTINDVDFSKLQFVNVNTVSHVFTNSKKLSNDDDVVFDSVAIKKIFKTLFSFKKYVDSIHPMNRKSAPLVISDRKIELRQSILAHDLLEIGNRVEAIAEKRIESITHSARLFFDTRHGRGIELDQDKLQFVLVSPKNTTVSIRFQENN